MKGFFAGVFLGASFAACFMALRLDWGHFAASCVIAYVAESVAMEIEYQQNGSKP